MRNISAISWCGRDSHQISKNGFNTKIGNLGLIGSVSYTGDTGFISFIDRIPLSVIGYNSGANYIGDERSMMRVGKIG